MVTTTPIQFNHGPAIMKTYEATVALLNKKRSPEGYGTESQHNIHFKAEDAVDAIQSAKRFGDRMVRQWPEEYKGVGCIKLYDFHPGPIDANGITMPSSGGFFFEWKYDWPGTFDQYVASFARKQERKEDIVPIVHASSLCATVVDGRVVEMKLSVDEFEVDDDMMEFRTPHPSKAAVKIVKEALKRGEWPEIEFE